VTAAPQPARPDAGPANIAASLPRQAAAQPFAPAIFAPVGRDGRGRPTYAHATYRQLDRSSDRIAHGLKALGAAPGTRVTVMVRPSLELFALVFGVFKAGAVPVLVDPGLGRRAVESCLARARPEVFIGVPLAQAARLALGWGRDSVRQVVTVGRVGPGVTLDKLERLGEGQGPAMAGTSRDDLAAILFTSGSTGPPKGAVYTHGNFLAQVAAIGRMYGIRSGEIDLPTFPLFALFDPALGMTTVLPEMDPTRPARVDPRKIVEAVEGFGVTTMFGSPALLDRVSRWGEPRGVRLPSLRRVISAGAPVPAAVLGRMRGLLDDAADIHTPYGATECLPVASIESREVLRETAAKTERGAGVCVGRVVPEAEVAIVGITDAPIATMEDAERLPPGEIGEIAVRGPQASRRYWDEDGHTRRAKIADGDGFWHRMGDLGYRDEDGRLWFCGRKSQRVETAAGPVFTAPVEGIFNAHPDVLRSALIGVRGEARAVLELEDGAQGRDVGVLTAELRAMAAHHEGASRVTRFHVHPGFPVDIRHNAKIRRGELAGWAKAKG
jgi:acyl-CoA synthetase (AMP-forming)/AMP-acid ligase II